MISKIYKTTDGKIIIEKNPNKHIIEKSQNLLQKELLKKESKKEEVKEKKHMIIGVVGQGIAHKKEMIQELLKEQMIEIGDVEKNNQGIKKEELDKAISSVVEINNLPKKRKKNKYKPKTFYDNKENEF